MTLRVWEADTGRLRYPPMRHRDKCHDVQFSPDGRLMALASYDGSVRVRDFATGAVVAELPAHPDIVYSAGFSPDGRLLVTACRDRTVRVWDWRAGRLACPPFEHAKDAVAATFTPDGRWVLSASVDGTARAWDWRTGKPVTPPLTIGGEPLSVAVTPDGKHAVVGGVLAALAVLDLGELARGRRRPGRALPLGRAARRPAAPRGGRHGQPVGRRVARPLAGVPPAIGHRRNRWARRRFRWRRIGPASGARPGVGWGRRTAATVTLDGALRGVPPLVSPGVKSSGIPILVPCGLHAESQRDRLLRPRGRPAPDFRRLPAPARRHRFSPVFGFLSTATAAKWRMEGGTRTKDHPMTLDPGRVQAVFLAALEQEKPADRVAVLDRECACRRRAAATGRSAPDRP